MSHSFKNKPNKKTYDAKLTELNDGVGHSTFNNIPEAAKECFNVSFWDKVKRPVNSINRFFDRFNDWSTPLRVAFWTVAAAGMAAAVVFTGGAAGVPALAAAGAYATTVITTGTLATTGVSVGAIAAPTILAATPTIYRRVKDFTLTVWNGAKNALSSLLGAADRADSVIVPLSVRQNTVVQTSVPVVVTSSDVLSQQQTTPPLTQESTSPLLISVPKESAVIMAENPKQEERVAQATNLSSDVLSQQQTTPPLTQESASPALVFPTKNDSDAAKMIVNEAQDKLVTDPAASKVAAKLLSKSPLMEILAPPSEIPEPSMEVAAAFHAHTVSLFGGKVFGAGRHFTSANDDTAAYVP